MDLAKLAEPLGLPKDSPQEKVFARLLEEYRGGTAAKESLGKLTEELKGYGLKLDQGKLVKVEESFASAEALAIKPTDDPEAASIKKELVERRKKDALSRMATIKSGVEKLIAEGRILPAAREALTRVCSISDKSTVLALSSDGTEVVSSIATNLGEELLKVLGTMPRQTGSAEGLSSLKTEPLIDEPKPKTDSEALAAKGRETAARVSKSSKTFKEKLATKK